MLEAINNNMKNKTSDKEKNTTTENKITENETNINSRLELIKSAQRRSSLSYLITVIISSAFIISIYNSLFSWDKSFGFESLPENATTKLLREGIMKNWINNRMLEIDLLGLKLSVSDFTVVGGVGLFIISVWMLLNVKRENSTIGTFLIETQKLKKETKEYIFHFVSSNQIFSNVFNEDKPLSNLDQKLTYKSKKETIINKIDEVLFYFPAMAIFCSIIGDLLSLIMASPIREDNTIPLWKILIKNDYMLGWVIGITVIGLILGALTAILNHKARRYEEATKRILKAYSKTFIE